MNVAPDMSGVIYRTGLDDRDYDEAITALQDAKLQPGNESSGCTVCTSSGHTATYCHHNPLIMARRAVISSRTWRCFHCGCVFTDAEKAQEHFGCQGAELSKCQADAKRHKEALESILAHAQKCLVEDLHFDNAKVRNMARDALKVPATGLMG